MQRFRSLRRFDRGAVPTLPVVVVLRSNLACHDGDLLKHARHVLNDVRVPKPKNNNASIRQPCVASPITAHVLCKGVLTTVELDRETQRRAVEIKHVWSGRVLSPKAMAVDLSTAQTIPKALFDDSRILAQVPRLCRLYRRAIKPRHAAHISSTMLSHAMVLALPPWSDPHPRRAAESPGGEARSTLNRRHAISARSAQPNEILVCIDALRLPSRARA